MKVAKGCKLTKERVDRATYTGAVVTKVKKVKGKDVAVTFAPRCVLWDTELRGFGLRTFPSGRKSFVFSFRVNGTKRLMDLGDYGKHTVDEARKAAKAHAVAVDKGGDPLAERVASRAKGLTVAKLWELYKASKKFAGKKSRDKDEYRFESTIEPKLGSKSIAAVTREVLKAWHEGMEDTPYEANRALALVSALWTWGRKDGKLPPATINPAGLVERYEETPRKRSLTEDEAGRLMHALDEEPNRYAAGAIKMLLLTGCRLSEVTRLTWDQVDLDRAVILLPDTKAGEPHAVALSPTAVRLLADLPEEKDNPHVFPGARKGDHIHDIAKPFARVLKAAKIDDLRIHDLRRSLGTWLINTGTRLEVVSRVLGHKRIETTRKHYAHLIVDSTRDALGSHGAKIEQLASVAAAKEAEKSGGA